MKQGKVNGLHTYKETERALDRACRCASKRAEAQVIRMNVSDDTNFLSVFSEDDTPVISGEVAEFIEASTQTVKPCEPLTLKIKSNCIDDEEKEIYRRAIRAYYTQKYIASQGELAKNRTIAILLALAGILVLALAFFVEYRHGSLIWAEVIDIVAWVFLWEATDLYFLASRKLKHDRRKYIAYVNMAVEFEDI